MNKVNQQEPKETENRCESCDDKANDAVRLSAEPGECRYSRTSAEPMDAPANFYLRARR